MHSADSFEGATFSDIQHTREDAQQQLDGVDRVALLPRAQMLALSFGMADEPVYVFIQWTPGQPENPYPGTAIWRAALERWLQAPPDDELSRQLLVPIARANLARFTSLNAWIRWCDHERERRRDQLDRRTRLLPTAGHLWPW